MSSSKDRYRFLNTLSFRLSWWYATAFILILLLALAVLTVSIDSALTVRLDEDMTEDIVEYRLLYAQGGTEAVLREIKSEMSENDANEIIRLIDSYGKEIYTSGLSDWVGVSVGAAGYARVLSAEDGILLETRVLRDQENATRIVHGLVGDNLLLQIGETMEDIEDIMELLLTGFVIMLGATIPIAFGVGWFVSRQAVKGIEEVSRAARAIGAGELESRVAVSEQRDEVQNLAVTFNTMADRIRRLVQEMREMIDNVAHDLRSPIARIRAISEISVSQGRNEEECKKAAETTLEECDRLILLINTTLDVAEAEAGVAIAKKEEVDLSTLTSDACELFEPVAEEKQIELSCKVQPDCLIFGDKQSLQRMIANLLDNALKYTPPRGKVGVDLASSSDDIRVSVSDSGVGIPEPDQGRVFDRFFRCDQSRNTEGCGLGLSFARAVARSHGGDINLRSMPALSSTFTIILPNTASA